MKTQPTPLELAALRVAEARDILADNPNWKPAQERLIDAKAIRDRMLNEALAKLRPMKTTIITLTLCIGLLAGCKSVSQPNNPPSGHDPLLDYPVGKSPRNP